MPDPPPIATAWNVVTGPPSAGKTSVLAALAVLGHRIIDESARAHIESLGKSADEIAADPNLQIEIQHAIASRQQAVEDRLSPTSALFLDRALPDSIAYFRRLSIADEDLVKRAATYRYRHVFFLEGLPLTRDGLRFEDDREARALGDEIFAAYAAFGYAPIRVPAFGDRPKPDSIARRVAFLLAHLRVDAFAKPSELNGA